MYFTHADEIWATHPSLRALTLTAGGLTSATTDEVRLTGLAERIDRRQSEQAEAQMPEIAAWREAFARMGLKPTQYRCASEALLRRYRKDKSLPSFHPLVDYLNHVSMAYAVPIAVFDVAHVDSGITVRPATGTESYETFQGDIENPAPGEVVFGDPAGHAHSRRWTFRQSARSAISKSSESALIVAEAHHASAAEDLTAMEAELKTGLAALGVTLGSSALLSESHRLFEF
ncbi:phenylalanine--tRNA ligase beta subunit-related protein [Streptomyces sp. NPDC005897]|uniref:B3/B4 domain-containing protein n=1 Tax=Streptomyces sp. NPDC005897 TaxID=3157081 RepID=UPI0033D10E29